MGRVKRLTPDIYGKIAAGEVIERPSSIIRELIDNSIDAGSSHIEIDLEWEEDFIILIKDNGSGIHADDLSLVIERHATSKIEEFEDIYTTNTHGFRGEALASIASIAKVEIISATNSKGMGMKMLSLDSKVENIEPCNHPQGTTIKISQIFENTPVRKKFLKSVQSEKNEIKKEVIRQCLGMDQIHFVYRVKNKGKWKEEIMVPKTYGLKDKIDSLFNKDISEHLIEIESKEVQGFNIKGFITSHRYKAKTRKEQFFLVKNRVIQNATITTALNAAYTNVLPVRTFSACFLFIESVNSFIDINVHPQKKDVRFEEGDRIYSAVYNRVKEILYQFVYSSQNVSFKQSVYSAASSPKVDLILKEDKPLYGEASANPQMDIFQSTTAASANSKTALTQRGVSLNELAQPQKNGFKSKMSQNPTRQIYQKNGDTTGATSLPNFMILGQVGDCYIIYSVGNDLYIADQHAIHERINFDRLKQKIESSEVDYQYLLVPLTIEKNKSDIDIILERKTYLESVGISVEKFGEKIIKVEKIPAFIPKGKETKFISDLFDMIVENQYLKRSEVLEKILSTMACRMSIMAGDIMTGREMEDLICALYEKDYIHNCPHGRPFVKKVGFDEMNHFFERH